MTDLSVTDGLANTLANIGTARDKAAASTYVLTQPDPGQIEAAYRTSATARKVVDLPAEDAFREWREWQAEAEQITAIEAEERRLGLAATMIAATKTARLRGGAAVYIGANYGDPALPLNPRAVGQGKLEYLTVLSRDDLTEGEGQRDPRKPGFGRPAFYTLATGEAAAVRIHPSRLVVLRGEEVPRGILSATDAWGDSALWPAMEAIRNLDATAANIASLVFEAKVDVVKIGNLMQNLASRGAAYEAELTRRFALAAAAKGTNGMLLLGDNEEYSSKSYSFGTLHEILDRFMVLVAAAAGIPVTRLFGRSPAGLNATGESDTRDYYDRIRTIQSLEIGPAMAILDECLIRSALGDRPEELHYTWRPLWQPSAKDRADVGKVLVETLKDLRDMGVVSDEALGKAAVNGLTECGAFPGLEAAVEEFPVTEPDEIERGIEGRPGDPPAEGEEEPQP